MERQKPEGVQACYAQNPVLDTGTEEVVTAIPLATESRVGKKTITPAATEKKTPDYLLSELRMLELLASARGVSKNLAKSILATLGLSGLVDALQNNPEKLTQVKSIKAKRLSNIMKQWDAHLKTCQA